MSELLQAAKAVISYWDCVSHARLGYYVEELRDAVERTEKQEVATDFCDWWHSNDYGNYGIHHAQLAWTAAQQVERERIKEIIHDNRDVFMEGGFCLIVEKIDDVS